MARHWRCANGHTWTGEIGALTYCPECNSHDVFEVRAPGAADATLHMDATSAKTFSQPRRAPKDAPQKPRPAAPDPNMQALVPPNPMGASTIIQPPAGRSDATAVQFPAAAADTTVTQMPAATSPGQTPVQPSDSSKISTQVILSSPANEATRISIPSAAGQTLIQPIPDAAGKTLVCEVQGGPGTGEPMVCVPGSESPTFLESSTSDSTLDLPRGTTRDAKAQFNPNADDQTIETDVNDSTGTWDEPDNDATALTGGDQSGQSATDANSRAGRRSDETAETKLKPGRGERNAHEITGRQNAASRWLRHSRRAGSRGHGRRLQGAAEGPQSVGRAQNDYRRGPCWEGRARPL